MFHVNSSLCRLGGDDSFQPPHNPKRLASLGSVLLLGDVREKRQSPWKRFRFKQKMKLNLTASGDIERNALAVL